MSYTDCKGLCLDIERKFTNTVNENVKCFPIHFEMDKYLISKKDCFERKEFAKNDLHTLSADDNTMDNKKSFYYP